MHKTSMLYSYYVDVLSRVIQCERRDWWLSKSVAHHLQPSEFATRSTSFLEIQMDSKDNAAETKLWGLVEKTDPQYTKEFLRDSGFKGTAINATYLAKKATQVFGPMGLGWGVKVLEERYDNGAPLGFDSQGNSLGFERIHVLKAELWYILDGKRGTVEHFGQTTFVGKTSRGVYTDEEAPKKSLTDATTKCLSMLGFAADVHMGLYDDNKYVAELRQEFTPNPQGQPPGSGGQQQQQAPGKTEDAAGSAAGPRLSERYQRYRSMMKEGHITSKTQARATVKADGELSEMEKALLLSSPEMQDDPVPAAGVFL
jgi:hypothetical protein